MTLEIIKPADRPFVNVLLYGAPKSGKSTAAGSAPGGVLYLNLDLPNATQFAHRRADGRIMEARFEGMQTLVDVHATLAKQAAEGGSIIDTVVVDPIGDLYRRLLEEASNRAVRPTLSQYGDVGTHVERFCRMLCEAPVNVVLVAHEMRLDNDATGQPDYLPWTGTSNPAMGSKLMGMVDVVAHTSVVQTKDGNQYMGQLVSEGGRRGGDRFNVLGDRRVLDLAEWFAVINPAAPTNNDQPVTTPAEGATV